MATSRDVLTEELLSEEWGDEQQYIDDRATLSRGQRRFDEMRAALAELPEGFSIERVREVSMTTVAAGEGGSQAEFYRDLVGLPETQRADIVCRWVVLDERARPPRTVAGVVRRRQIGRQGITCSPFAGVGPEVARAIAVALNLAAADAEGRS